MNVIKFSHDYPKLHGQRRAQLIAIRFMNVPKDMKPELLEYDTATTDGKHDKLEPGRYRQLFFIGEKHIPFCTIRKDRPAFGGMVAKNEFYHARIGLDFDIVIEEKDGK